MKQLSNIFKNLMCFGQINSKKEFPDIDFLQFFALPKYIILEDILLLCSFEYLEHV